MKTVAFSKVQGLGNDFIVIDARHQQLDVKALKAQAPSLCARRFGIGADGIVLLVASDTADFGMLIINADGSVPEMCGNGLRCLARFCYDKNITDKDSFTVETGAGVLAVQLCFSGLELLAFEVDMGKPHYDDSIHSEPVSVQKRTLESTLYSGDYMAVSMGNPHAVILNPSDYSFEFLEKIGNDLQTHDQFPSGVNLGLARVLNVRQIELSVWERGAGATLACGTGACAAAVAAMSEGLCDRQVQVTLPGGTLEIEWRDSDDHVMMRGPAEHVYDAEFQLG